MSTKRKIEDYKGKDVAIQCSSKEEWDKIDNLFGKKGLTRDYGDISNPDNMFVDCIHINGMGTASKEGYEQEGYIVYPASDFLKENPQFEVGKWYTHDKWSPNSYIKFHSIRDYNSVNELERISQGSYKKEINWSISYEHSLKAVQLEEIQQYLPEDHPDKIVFKRTQAQGFNWYKCGYGGNWITEEGVELIKEDVPEYIECYHLDRNGSDVNFTIGKVYKVKDGSPIDDSGSHRIALKVKGWKHWFKSSTREAFDLQNKPITMNEDIFCIELNSQKELDAIMDFYKQKGFKELGDSHDYRNDYVVFIKMKDKKWQTSVCNDLNYPVKTLFELGIEVKSKSLVGRYVKALRNINILKKGDYDLILSEDPTFFQCEKSLLWSKSRFEEGDFELMPEGFKLEDDLISEAKKRYPIGTKFRPAHIPGSDITEYCIVTEDSIFHKNGDQIVLTINGEYWIDRENPKYGNTNYNRFVYYQGKWAEIVSDEPEINTYGLKVGDKLPNKIITEWSKKDLNYYTTRAKNWKKNGIIFLGDREVTSFEILNGIVGFKVSDTLDVYLKAEGFKEFAVNFYKKEVKSWIQEQDEMLNVIIKQHPLTPKECYPSNEIIIPQIIKAQKTIQKITIESPTELDLKLKTIKPKQIQTIKI